jgi:hypothetical protein
MRMRRRKMGLLDTGGDVRVKNRQVHGLIIEHISIGFKDVVSNKNFADSHQSLQPFGLKWGRGILVKGQNYLEAITGPYGISHSKLKEGLTEDEQTAGAFYYGYDLANKTLYLEYASDGNFDFYDEKALTAIMNALKNESGPLKDFRLQGQ